MKKSSKREEKENLSSNGNLVRLYTAGEDLIPEKWKFAVCQYMKIWLGVVLSSFKVKVLIDHQEPVATELVLYRPQRRGEAAQRS